MVRRRAVKTGTSAEPVEGVTPIIVDAGRRSRKAICRLKECRGRLMEEVADIVEDARAPSGEGKEIVAIVIIYKQKSGTRARLSLPFPSSFDLLR